MVGDEGEGEMRKKGSEGDARESEEWMGKNGPGVPGLGKDAARKNGTPRTV